MVEVNDDPLDAARIAAAFQSVQMDFSGSGSSFGYSGGRDLSSLTEDARDGIDTAAYPADTSGDRPARTRRSAVGWLHDRDR
jgi:hypothetical protein